MNVSLFTHPDAPHLRRHGPIGYKDYGGFKPWLRDEFCFRCVYCLEREKWYPDRAASFSVEHVVPQSKDSHLICEYTNLIYACTRCNSIRRNLTLLDPTIEAFGNHLRLNDHAHFIGLTPEGNDLIDILRLNKTPALQNRLTAIHIRTLFTQHPTDLEIIDLFNDYFGFPDDLPDLQSLRPPDGNSLPKGAEDCYFEQKKRGVLPLVY